MFLNRHKISIVNANTLLSSSPLVLQEGVVIYNNDSSFMHTRSPLDNQFALNRTMYGAIEGQFPIVNLSEEGSTELRDSSTSPSNSPFTT
jgi:hypothetical protein